MFDDKEEFFRDRPVGIDSDVASSEAAFRVLMKRFPSIGSIQQLKSLCKSQTTSSKLSLAWFSDEFTTFPVRMNYKKVPWVRDMWDGLYSRFTKTDLYDAWKEELDDWKNLDGKEHLSKPMAIVFQWPKWKMCCMHNCESKRFGGSWYSASSNQDGKDSMKIVRSLGNGETYIIEPFDQFLETINWSN